MRIGIVRELGGKGYQQGVLERFHEALDILTRLGATVEEVSCPSFAYALPAYYLIMPSEASSNLARFDAMRYGIRVNPAEGPVTVETVMGATREAGFGPEVKRRIILGTYALSAGYYDAYYGSAQKVRTLIQRDFEDAWNDVDVLVSPTTPTTAFKLGEKLEDPLSMYLSDVATIPANLAGTPGISVPGGLAEDGLPVGIQVLAPARSDAWMYRVAGALEGALQESWGGPLLDQAPVLPEGAQK
jgi:aspartyl-tRNA(Asn)/glutamyl-tRNA(Gln) amidotransferase subunit A